MNRTTPAALALLAVISAGGIARAQPTSTGVVGVRDRAGMFSAAAVKEADQALHDLQRKTHWAAAIETVDSLDGKTIKDAAVEKARARKVHGLYILLAKKEHKFYAEPSHQAERVFTREKIKEVDDAILAAFKAGKFDAGLHDAVALIRRDAESSPDTSSSAIASASAPAHPGTPVVAAPPAPPAPPARPATPAAPAPPARPALPAEPARPVHDAQQGSVLPMLLIGGGAVLLVLWLLSRAFRGTPSAPPQSFNQGGPGGYAPAPGGPAPQGQPGYAPQGQQPGYRPPAQQPGYAPQGQPGYAPPPPGYGPPQPGYGYAPPPPQHGGGGGFMSGVLGGAAGAVAGNILYDKFGRPHEGQGVPTHNPAGAFPPQETHGAGAGVGAGAGAGAAVPPEETYDPNAGGGGDWGTPDAAPQSNTDASAGGDWGTPEPAADPGAGGDWGTPEPAPDAGGGDWGAPDPAPDAGGGGDWGGADPAPDDNQGGSW